MDDVAAVYVCLKVDGERYLRVALGSDGSIERAGREDAEGLRGTAAPRLFEQLRRRVTPELLRWGGQSWSDPFPRGKRCQLVVGFTRSDGRQVATRWEYGSESPEPPAEVRAFVLAAVEAANAWYRERLEDRSGWRLVGRAALSPNAFERT